MPHGITFDFGRVDNGCGGRFLRLAVDFTAQADVARPTNREAPYATRHGYSEPCGADTQAGRTGEECSLTAGVSSP